MELLAPQAVIFYDRAWNELGSKAPQEARLDLADDIEASTGIARAFTSGARDIQTASISKRMSWAARRVTSRQEDLAYCLLGIFQINIPMLYGEGDKAFLRLQEEILKGSDDHTLFAWADSRIAARHGLLADSPSAFLNSDKLVPFSADDDFAKPTHSPVVTNRGLNIELALLGHERHPDSFSTGSCLAMLECGHEDGLAGHGYIGIFLTRERESPRHYTRVACHGLRALMEPPMTTRSIFVRQEYVQTERTRRPGHLIRPHNVQHRSSNSRDLLFLGDEQRDVPRDSDYSLALHVLGKPTAHFPIPDGRFGIITLPAGSDLLAAYTMLFHPATKTAVVLMLGSNEEWELCFDVWRYLDPMDILLVRKKGNAHTETSAMPQCLRDAYVPHNMGTTITKLSAVDVTVDKVVEEPFPQDWARPEQVSLQITWHPKQGKEKPNSATKSTAQSR